MFLSVMAKNLNWEISTKNLVTFKRWDGVNDKKKLILWKFTVFYSLFICMQKINFIIPFFLTILHFKESCNLIGWQHFGP